MVKDKPIIPTTQKSDIKYTTLQNNVDPYYRGSSIANHKVSNGYSSKNATNSLLANGSAMPNGSTTRLLFV